MEMIGVAFVCPNIWISPDQYMVRRLPGADEYVKAIKNYFRDRTVFGTAYPSRPHGKMVKEYNEFEFDQLTLEKIMFKNALRLMKMT